MTDEPPLWECGFSIRTAGALARAGIATKEALLSTSEPELLALPNFGIKSLAEVKDWLAAECPGAALVRFPPRERYWFFAPTPREIEAEALRAQGCTYEQIGGRLGVTRNRAWQILIKLRGKRARMAMGEVPRTRDGHQSHAASGAAPGPQIV